MIICPDCQAENTNDAKTCHACGHALAPAEAASAPLPQWLQQLKPEVEADVPQEALAMSKGPTAALFGTDSLVAASPKGAAPASRDRSASRREAAVIEAAKGGNAAETASLISEDDLPAWLRAFGEAETKNTAAASTDESWMVGAEAASTTSAAASQNLAHSWPAPARSAEVRARTSGASSIFAKPADNAAKQDRVMAIPAAAVPTPEPSPAPRASNARPDLPRPKPTTREQGGMSLQRVALIAFIAALVIFLIVVGIFLVRPSI